MKTTLKLHLITLAGIAAGFGKLHRIGKLPVNFQVQTFYNVVTPDYGADWQLRFQVQFLFPK